MKTQIPTRDLIQLSAYLDGQLPSRQASRMAKRLDDEPELQSTLAELRRARGMLRAAPRLRASRNFTLTPAMVGQPVRGGDRFAPAYRLVSAVASLLLVLVVAGEFINTAMMRTADQAMPLMAEVEQPGAAMEMEAPASKALEAAPGGEIETFALQSEPTVDVAQEMEAGAVDRAEKSEPAQEPVPDEPFVEEMAEAEAVPQAPPEGTFVEEAPLMLAAPAAEGPPAGVEGSPEGEMGGLGEVLTQPVDEEMDLAELLEAQNGAGNEPDIEAFEDQGSESQVEQDRGLFRTGWPWFRVAEVSLALVALSFGLLAWFYRARR
jgi:anti-sigma factor RsiW